MTYILDLAINELLWQKGLSEKPMGLFTPTEHYELIEILEIWQKAFEKIASDRRLIISRSL